MKNVIPAVSVIIPVYNAAAWLGQCLSSIEAQNFDDYEIICINDGSTDASSTILREYAKKNRRITVINQKNTGPGTARNKGICVARGKYIAFIDADDWIAPDFFKILFSAAEDTKAALISFNSCMTDGEQFIKNIVYFNLPDKTVGTAKMLKTKIFDAAFHSTHFLYRTDFIKSNRLLFPAEIFFCEDVLFVLKALLLAPKICFLQKFLYYYRQHSSSLVATKDSRKINLLKIFPAIEKIITVSPLVFDLMPRFRKWKVDMLSCLYSQLDASCKHLLYEYAKKNLTPEELNKLYQNIKRDNTCLVHCFWLPLFSVEKTKNNYLVKLFGKLVIGSLRIKNTLKELKIYWWHIPLLHIKKCDDFLLPNGKTNDSLFNYHFLKRTVMDEQRLIDIEMTLANQERTLDELSAIVFEQGQKIDNLLKLNKYLMDLVDKDTVKPLAEETPPPHY